jgi:hypothetical protein
MYVISLLLFSFSSPLANHHWLFIANYRGQHGSALKKNGIDTTAPPTISVTAPPNMTILYYSFCFYYI